MEAELERLLIDNDDFARLEDALSVFCPFAAVGMLRQEIRHGAFLTYLLNPMRPHGFGDECVRALMAVATAAARGPSATIRPLDAHLMGFDDATARQWRDVDILVEVSSQKLIIAVELKIDANEHSGQLRKYKKAVEAEWPGWRHVFLFLTKHGDEPSEADGAGWCAVELESLADALDRVVRRGSGAEGPRALLAAYLAMLRREHLTDEKLERLAKNLWDKHREALEFLSDRRPDALSDAMAALNERRDGLAQALSNGTSLNIVVDSFSGNCLRLAVADWDSIPKMRSALGWTQSNRLVLAEIRIWPTRAAGAYLMLGPGDAVARNTVHEKFVNGGAPVNKPNSLSQRYKRLASKTILRVKPDEELDSVAFSTELEEKSMIFLADQIRHFNKALQKSGF